MHKGKRGRPVWGSLLQKQKQKQKQSHAGR